MGNYCCKGTYSEEELKSSSLTDADLLTLLKHNQTGVVTILCFQVCVFVLWTLATLIPGFNLYDGAAGSTNAYTHTGWWMMIEFLVLAAGLPATFFGLHYSYSDGWIEKGISRVVNWIWLYIVMLALGTIAHLVHAILACFEAASGTSTLWKNYLWAGIMLIVFLFVWAALNLWQMYRVRTYQNNLFRINYTRELDLSLTPSEKRPAAARRDANKEYNEPPGTQKNPDATAPELLARRLAAARQQQLAANVTIKMDDNAQLETPLLAQMKAKTRHGSTLKTK